MYSVTPYTPCNFWTALGAVLKMNQLTRRGFPHIRNWRFITLTINQRRFSTPLEAYEAGKRQIRQAVYELRKRGFSIARYCWKLELHQPDESGEQWPHWHLLVDYKRPIPAESIRAAWRLGRVDVQGVTDSRFDYLFKYVAKSIDGLPAWIAGLVRPRCWQTSRNFFANHAGAEKEEKASPRQAAADRRSDTQNETVSLHRETLGERMQRWSTSCVVRSLYRQANGRPFCRVLELERDWGHACATFARRLLRNSRTDEDTITQNNIKTSCLQSIPLKNPLLALTSFPASLSVA